MIANNNILIFLDNSYLLKFNINGDIIDVKITIKVKILSNIYK